MALEEIIGTEVCLGHAESWRTHKNVIVVSLAFMLHFTAYSGAANLQSSINAEAGLGTASLAAVSAAGVFSNLFLPALVIKWLGTKWAMCLCFLMYIPYIGVQMKPTFYTLIPTGVIVGLADGPLWCSKGKYLSMLSTAHSKLSNVSAGVLLVRFLGLFFMINNLSQVWGNLISSLVISSGDNSAAVTSLNASLVPELCGANFLPASDAIEALQPQPQEKIQMFSGIYIACMVCAALFVAVGLDSPVRYNWANTSESSPSGLSILVVTIKLLTEPNQLMLIIINAFIGFEQAFFGADFTAAFVACAIGTGSVGLVMMTSGLANAVGSVISGYLVKVTGRLPLIITASIVHTGLFITILTWRPQTGLNYVQYIIAVLWGLCDSIWNVQLISYCAILFPGREEAAFSNYALWVSSGYIISYLISPFLQTSSKIYLMMAMMVVGLIGYFTVEIRDSKSKKTGEINRTVTEEVATKEIIFKGCDNVGFTNIDL